MRDLHSDSTLELAAPPVPPDDDCVELRETADKTSDSKAIPVGLPIGQRARGAEVVVEVTRGFRREWLGFDLPAWMVSAVGHAWLLIVLGVWMLEGPRPTSGPLLVCSFAEPALDVTSVSVVMPSIEPAPFKTPDPQDQPLPEPPVAEPRIELTDDATSSNTGPRVSNEPGLSHGALLRPVEPTGGGLAGRLPARRAQLAATQGGTPESEAAVERGLRWLMAHQMPDGSWRFDHQKHLHCQGACRDPGTIGSSTASTALALLPFLGAGYTHEQGDYQRTVQNGLYYLSSRMVETRRGADLQEGTMYAQALATIVFCEAYTMTDDRALATVAQPALDFIVAAQHTDGGWRYYPGEPGDVTSTGWQIMALRSGQLARLRVASPTFFSASKFLDQVQEDYGSAYGYQTPGRAPTTSAIGLLCRMYLGWPPSHEALVRGADELTRQGPSPNNMYYNYYAAQVLHHLEAKSWPAWNEQLRDHLVASQAAEGHEAGSWAFDDPKTNVAGRLFDTSMAILNLEVYYRYLPLYGEEAVGSEP